MRTAAQRDTRLGVLTRDPPEDLARAYRHLPLTDLVVVLSGTTQAQAVRRLVPQTRCLGLRLTCLFELGAQDATLGILDSGVDGVCLCDPTDAAMVDSFVAGCHYPPYGNRGVATARDLRYGLDEDHMRRVLTQGSTTAIGIALTTTPDMTTQPIDRFAQLSLPRRSEQAETSSFLDFAALWVPSGQDQRVRLTEHFAAVVSPFVREIHLWGDVDNDSSLVPAMRAWDEAELLKRGFEDARQR